MDERVRKILDRITPLYLFMGMSGIGLLVMILGTCSMYDVDGPLPPPRDPPPPAEKSAVLSYRYKEGYYHSLMDDDCKKAGLDKISLKAMGRGNAYFAEFSGNQLLKPRGKLETAHLLIEALNKKIWVDRSGGGIRTAHLALKITNKTNRYLAFNVVTHVKGRCSMKGPLAQNAIALEPGGKITRTECLAQKTAGIQVLRVGVIELTSLGYHYVSRLDPVQIGLSGRTTAGHQVAKLPACKLIPWRMIKQMIKLREIGWYDVVDFYSRHSCDEYSFFRGYRWRKSGPDHLPARPPQAE